MAQHPNSHEGDNVSKNSLIHSMPGMTRVNGRGDISARGGDRAGGNGFCDAHGCGKSAKVKTRKGRFCKKHA